MSKHPLSGFGQFDPDERQATEEWQHEEAVVKALLGIYRQPDAKFEILKLSRIRTGQNRLSLKVLREVTGISDKFFFETAIVPGLIKNCTLDKMLRRFETRTFTQRFFERYDEHQNSDLSGLDYAMVIKCSYVPVGIVMHTSMNSTFAKGYRFVVAGKTFAMILETFEQFAKTELRGAGR